MTEKIHVPVLRLCSVLCSSEELLEELLEELRLRYGPLEERSQPFPFDASDYYAKEMGDSLSRYWICFERLCDASELAGFRGETGELEKSFSAQGKRRLNIDPGYLDFGKLVLASMKEAPDKIYLKKGVWAHTCLRYRFGHWEAPDHSFPDFADGRFNAFFLKARELYRIRRRALLKNPKA